ncbi:vitamin K epoxide reductase family protein [Rarobacter incanus]|uniref:Putative membrane protein n=1 Tax=Rarobacter incanus TaxID=153494 RepID=A0A542SMV3_9MICO|nr:vitamin K epoxide reductase family protein [Rarobacter incanus]TQK75961.1 putative membrane protein [Rarobacter incanus]
MSENKGALEIMNGKRTGIWLAILGTIALWASADLAIERYRALIDPNYIPSCSVSIFVDCAPAMGSAQGAIFGFPNPYLGLGAFPVVMTIGIIMAGGWRPPAWLWRTFTVVSTAALALVVFLIFTSVHTIERLCPYCMVVWAMMIPLWWILVAYAMDRGFLGAPKRAREIVVTYRSFFILGTYVAVALWIVIGMWSLIAG